MPLSVMRKHQRTDQRVAAGLIVLGASVVVASATSAFWGVNRGLPASDAGRLAALNEEIRTLQKKFLAAELRGIRVDPVPRRFRDLESERSALLELAEYAKERPERYAGRVRLMGLALMAAGVVVFFVSRMRKRPAS